MVKCELHLSALSPYPGSGGGYHAACRCVTHHWDFGQQPVTNNQMCPLGRIEELVERIEARLDAKLAALEEKLK